MSDGSDHPGKVRLDKWLWAARFFKTRSLAKAAIESGKVHLDGQRVKVANDLGEVLCRLRLSHDQRPGVVELPKGLWAHNTDNGFTACALAPDSVTDLGDGACFNDARVEVSPA